MKMRSSAGGAQNHETQNKNKLLPVLPPLRMELLAIELFVR